MYNTCSIAPHRRRVSKIWTTHFATHNGGRCVALRTRSVDYVRALRRVMCFTGICVANTDSRHFKDLVADIYRFAPIWAKAGDTQR